MTHGAIHNKQQHKHQHVFPTQKRHVRHGHTIWPSQHPNAISGAWGRAYPENILSAPIHFGQRRQRRGFGMVSENGGPKLFMWIGQIGQLMLGYPSFKHTQMGLKMKYNYPQMIPNYYFDREICEHDANLMDLGVLYFQTHPHVTWSWRHLSCIGNGYVGPWSLIRFWKFWSKWESLAWQMIPKNPRILSQNESPAMLHNICLRCQHMPNCFAFILQSGAKKKPCNMSKFRWSMVGLPSATQTRQWKSTISKCFSNSNLHWWFSTKNTFIFKWVSN